MVAADLNEVSTRLFIEDWEPGRRKANRVENQLQVLIKRLGRKNMIVSIHIHHTQRAGIACSPPGLSSALREWGDAYWQSRPDFGPNSG